MCSKISKKTSVSRDFLNKDTMKIIDISEMSLGSRTFKALLGSSVDKKEKTKQRGTGIK